MDPQELKRNYTGTDAFMTESARVNYNLANGDLSKFTAFDSTINGSSCRNRGDRFCNLGPAGANHRECP